MASIKSALKKVYKSLSGGTDSSAKSISGIIDDISTVASGGSGGGGVLWATMTYDGDVVSLDKTWRELKTAFDEGMIIFAKYTLDNSTEYIDKTYRVEALYDIEIYENGDDKMYTVHFANETFISSSQDEWIPYGE